MHQHSHEPDWVHGHPHDPNPAPPSTDSRFRLRLPDGTERVYDVADLVHLPQTEVSDCYIISTGHESTGPFTFGGIRLLDFLGHMLAANLQWATVDVISGDGFGTRLQRAELEADPAERPSLLALTIDGQPLTREQGLIRLIVPTETDDALKQVKWVGEIVIRDS